MRIARNNQGAVGGAVQYRSRWLAILALGLVCVATVWAGVGWSQPDCQSVCEQGQWNPFLLKCRTGTAGGCSHCEVVCPAGGSGGGGCETPHCGPFNEN